MLRSWDEIKWIFKVDGSLRDIYVQDVSIAEWEKLIDLLNNKYWVTSSIAGEEPSNRIDKEYAIKYLTENNGEMNAVATTIHIDNLKINCHFFLAEQIELDVDPKEVTTIEDIERIQDFMEDISKCLDRQVTLTAEDDPVFPLIKMDHPNGIQKALTEIEADQLCRNQPSISSKLKAWKTRLKMMLFPERFKRQLIESATGPYESTQKDKNVW